MTYRSPQEHLTFSQISKRQKLARKNDPNSEAAITRSIRYYLRLKKILHFKHWAGLGSEPGIPDICGVMPDGRALFIEIKKMNGKLSEAQELFLREAKANGAVAFVARSIDDVMEFIK